VFAAALLEALAVIGTVIPGSSIVFVGGMLVGLNALDPWWTAGAAVSGAILGDGVSYWLGRHHHQRLLSMWPLKSHPEIFERGQAYFAKNGGKSVFLGRFLGPVRAIVPVIAGMSGMAATQFYLVNVVSAFAWVAAHMLPGMLFGASLQVAAAVSSRLALLLGLLVASLWALGWIVRLALSHGLPVLKAYRDRLVDWAASKPGLASRLILSLFDPARPEAPAMLVATLFLLGGTWLFLGILEDVVSNDSLVQFDRGVLSALQGFHAAWADNLMVAATELGSGNVAVPVVIAVAVVLAVKRCWRTLAYWIGAVTFAQALVWVIKMALARTRPTDLYQGFEQYSFPSGHTASAFVIYGFLAVLIAQGKPRRTKIIIAVVAGAAILLVAISRLYLRVHWVSDVLASLSLGTAWVALLSIAYAHHVRNERLPARLLGLVVVATLTVAGTFYVSRNHSADLARFTPRDTLTVADLANWRGDGWLRLPANRSEVGGDPEEPMTVQWAASSGQIASTLVAHGWQVPAPWASSAALLWLLPTTAIGELPVLPKWDHGQPQQLTFEKVQDRNQRLVLRLWSTGFQVATVDGHKSMLWNGMATMERLDRVAGLVTLTHTDSDFVKPRQQLTDSASAAQLAVEIRQRGSVPVALIW
jgi:membrane protein DedA with SNARE-associated domain/membrane-associated phospholipid phosphatase